MFDANKIKDELVDWIRDWFKRNGPDSKAVIGISGGKDSTVAAALLVEALGRDRVFGVLMPNGKQSDLADSRKVCKLLGIDYEVCNIARVVKEFRAFSPHYEESKQATENLPPRIRMALLYYISQNMDGRVCNTCNLSEDYLGYSTRWGDECGDFAPLRGLTCTEVMKVGDALGLPPELTHKTPSDGLCGKTDEDRFGFTYRELDKMLRLELFEMRYSHTLPEETYRAMERWHKNSEFKRHPIPFYEPHIDKPYRLGLILGRFQPLHDGHMSMIYAAFSLCDEVLIMVGSAQESGTYNNPLDYETRRQMILDAIDEYRHGRLQILPIADAGLGNNAKWGDYVLAKVKEARGELPDAFFTGEETRRTGWFEGSDIETIVVNKVIRKLENSPHASDTPISASIIREKLYAGDWEWVRYKIPNTDWRYLKEAGIIGNPPAKKETKSI